MSLLLETKQTSLITFNLKLPILPENPIDSKNKIRII